MEHRTLQIFREGHLIDLLSNDIQRMEMAPEWIFDMVSLIYFFPVIIYLFVNLFPWKALVGLLFLVALVPNFLYGSDLVGKLRRQTANLSDKRIALIDELVTGIRAVKTQAWEHNYQDSVKKIRK